MKPIEDMTQEEVIEAITILEQQCQEQVDQVDIELLEDLYYAKLHNFPHLI